MSDTEDPRVSRTRRALHAAIFELIQERRWSAIRVQDILDRSGVSRSAFYAHYDNQLDLLTSAVPAITALPGGRTSDGPPDVRPLFEHVARMAPVLRPLLTQPVLGDITRAFERDLEASFAQQLPPGHDNTAAFLAAGLVAILRRTITGATPPDWDSGRRQTEAILRVVFREAAQGD